MQKIASIILFLFCVKGNAQQAFTNTGNLQIHTGASVKDFGNFTNTSAAGLVNNGNFYIAGNITNNQSAMTTGAGTLYLNGSSAQSIAGSQTFKTYNLVTSNAAGFTLNNNLSVSGAHTFTNGIIASSATPNYLVYEAGSSYTGDSDTKHVNGWVKKIGSTNFVFPVGNGTVERTIALSNLSANSEFSAKYFANTPYPNDMELPLQDINESEYWHIEKTSGGTAQVTMNWDNSKVAFPNWIVPDIRAAWFNGAKWINIGGTAGGDASTTGTITSNSVTNFYSFALGSQSYILPLTLISFTANHIDNYTQIEWTAGNEYNMTGYIAERSNDGTAFYPVAQTSPRNSGNIEQYYTRDYQPISRIAYYRLRFKEINGSESLSKIVTVKVDSNSQLTLVSNPVHDKILLLANPSLKGTFRYSVVAMNGQLTQQGKILIQNGGYYQLDLNGNIKPGTYTLEVSNGIESFRYKIAVEY